jgi:hypothetical protein
MTTVEAKERIFTQLCEEHKKPGSDGWVDRDKLVEDLAIPLEVFSDAFAQMRGNHDLYIEINKLGMMRLGRSTRRSCDSGTNPFTVLPSEC